MALVRRHEQISVLLDWVTVRYQTLWLALAIAAAVAVGAGLVLWRVRGRDQREAQIEIQQAEHLHEEAAIYARDDRLTELLRNATNKLGEARQHYDRRDFSDARTAAIVSQNNSQQLIDMGRGEATTRGEVRFYKIEGEVRVKRAGQFAWEPATGKTMLRLGDQVKTSMEAAAQIIYFDGSITTIKAGSLLEIKELYEEPASRQRRVTEKLNFGEIESSTRRQETEGSFHEVTTESSVARSREEAQFLVRSQQGTGDSEISLFSGKVDVAAGGRKLALSEREMVKVRGGKMGEAERLPVVPRLVQPPDQKVFTYPEPSQARTTLVWERVGEAARYKLQISERPLFTDTVLDNEQIRATSVELRGLEQAGFYWRVAAIDAQGHVGPFSPPRKFRISTARLREKADHEPPKLSVQDFVQNGPIVIVNGKTEPGATVWVDNERVDVDDRGDFSAVVRLRHDGVNRIRLVAQDAEGNETSQALEAVVEAY